MYDDGYLDDVACPKCGATGRQPCSTKTGRDHIARNRAQWKAEGERKAREKKEHEAPR